MTIMIRELILTEIFTYFEFKAKATLENSWNIQLHYLYTQNHAYSDTINHNRTDL